MDGTEPHAGWMRGRLVKWDLVSINGEDSAKISPVGLLKSTAYDVGYSGEVLGTCAENVTTAGGARIWFKNHRRHYGLCAWGVDFCSPPERLDDLMRM
jgi:hypothetical protein